MKIACLSGKGGAGKTFVSVNLALAIQNDLVRDEDFKKEDPVTYIDCDVEEPNGRLFFNPVNIREQSVGKLLPEFDDSKCNGCKECVKFCRFHALMYIKEKPMVFPEVCHSCGGCMMVCPEHAVWEKEKPIGTLEIGFHNTIKVVTGILNPGEASGIPIIKEALRQAEGVTVIDCPPGSACSVMESVMDADYCVLVVEPTAFGFHNFKMVHELVSLLHRKCGVVMNKESGIYDPLEEYCKRKNLPVLVRIPYDSEIAAKTAEGKIISEYGDKMKNIFEELYCRIEAEVYEGQVNRGGAR